MQHIFFYLFKIIPYRLTNRCVNFIKKILLNFSNSLPLSPRQRISYAAKLHAYSFLKQKNKLVKHPDQTNISVIIGGPPRIGKTQIAMFLAADLNAFIISLDRFKSFFSNLNRRHVETAKYEMLKIFCNYSENIIIEGDELITHQARLMRENFKKYPIAIPLLKKINLSLTSHLYIAGIAEYSVDEKVDHIYKWAEYHDCWLTSNLPKEEVASYTSLLIKTSADLKILSKKHGINYIEMGELNTQQAVEKILNDVALANSSELRGKEHNSFSFTDDLKQDTMLK